MPDRYAFFQRFTEVLIIFLVDFPVLYHTFIEFFKLAAVVFTLAGVDHIHLWTKK